LLNPGPGRGLARLPAPDPDDQFFDMEGDPLYPDGGLEYLFGIEGPEGFRGFGRKIALRKRSRLRRSWTTSGRQFHGARLPEFITSTI
jgi:hypothetical protein